VQEVHGIFGKGLTEAGSGQKRARDSFSFSPSIVK
jgi:hypothetical protein